MLNTIALIGRLTADPETNTVSDSTTVTRFRLAVARNDRRDDTADYLTVECWNGLANAVATYGRLGRRVVVHGGIRSAEWTTDDGSRGQRTYVLARTVTFLDPPPVDDQSSGDGD